MIWSGIEFFQVASTRTRKSPILYDKLRPCMSSGVQIIFKEMKLVRASMHCKLNTGVGQCNH